MKSKNFFSILILIFLAAVYWYVHKNDEYFKEIKSIEINGQPTQPLSQVENISYHDAVEDKETFTISVDLNFDGINEKFRIETTLGSPGDEKTQIFFDDGDQPELDLYGYFDGLDVYRIDRSKNQILVMKTFSGHSTNTTFYKYQNGQLDRVPVSTENPPYWYGIVSRNDLELEDIDRDGIMELLAYYRFFPPEAKREVELYKYDGQGFNLVKKYEEDMPEMYL